MPHLEFKTSCDCPCDDVNILVAHLRSDNSPTYEALTAASIVAHWYALMTPGAIPGGPSLPVATAVPNNEQLAAELELVRDCHNRVLETKHGHPQPVPMLKNEEAIKKANEGKAKVPSQSQTAVEGKDFIQPPPSKPSPDVALNGGTKIVLLHLVEKYAGQLAGKSA